MKREDSRTKDSMTRGRKPQGRGDMTGIIPVVRDKRDYVVCRLYDGQAPGRKSEGVRELGFVCESEGDRYWHETHVQ